MLPSQYPQVQSYGHLQRLLANHIDMQFEDVRLLLRLPRKGSSVGANFATAAVLFNIISGASLAFYNTSWKALKGKAGGSGERFRGVLGEHFPFAEITIPKKTTIDVFYKYSRNPLAHSFGLGDPKAIEVHIAKNALTPTRITELEDSATLPIWSRAALTETGIQPGPSYRLSISGLYWGVHRMLQSVFQDGTQAAAADQVAKQLGF